MGFVLDRLRVTPPLIITLLSVRLAIGINHVTDGLDHVTQPNIVENSNRSCGEIDVLLVNEHERT